MQQLKGAQKRLLMKFKVQFVSAVFNLRLLESQKTMKKPNQYRIFAQCKKNIETSNLNL
jgi:hypothetical protein